MNRLIVALTTGAALAFVTGTLDANTIVIPRDYPTIQQGVDASVDGDTVTVMPGTYVENILIDRDVVVRSVEGPAVTIIDGSEPSHPDRGSVVVFLTSASSSLSNSSIEGFDIRRGSGFRPYPSDLQGGGIYVGGGGLATPPGPGPLIFNNWIHDNWMNEGVGAGIAVQGVARIVSNRIFDNGFEGVTSWVGGAAFGGGSGREGEPLLLQDNEIFDNHVRPPTPPEPPPEAAVVVTGGNMSGNVVACNSGYGRSALSVWHVSIVELNTIAGNFSFSAAPAVTIGYGTCYDIDVWFRANNVTDNHGPGLECIECTGNPIYLVECNNFASNFPGGQVVGLCAAAIGQDGNISVDPLYGRVGCEPGYDLPSRSWTRC